MNNKNRLKLFEDYSIEITTDADSHKKFYDKYLLKDFIIGYINPEEIYSKREKDNIKNLNENIGKRYKLMLFILNGNKKIGLFLGRQEDHETFFMMITGILKKHRNKGIYKKMLPLILKILKEKGFQKVYSRHSVTNNNVIVPKLKAGFVISGIELNDSAGLFVQLTYYFNEVRRNIFEYRVTGKTPDKQITNLLNLNINK